MITILQDNKGLLYGNAVVQQQSTTENDFVWTEDRDSTESTFWRIPVIVGSWNAVFEILARISRVPFSLWYITNDWHPTARHSFCHMSHK